MIFISLIFLANKIIGDPEEFLDALIVCINSYLSISIILPVSHSSSSPLIYKTVKISLFL